MLQNLSSSAHKEGIQRQIDNINLLAIKKQAMAMLFNGLSLN